MTVYVKLVDDVVAVKSYVEQEGFDAAPEDTYVGYIKQTDGSYKAPSDLTFNKELVREHAEVLIDHGTIINGIQFSCDENSIRRLSEVMDGFTVGLPEAVQNRTMMVSGVLLELDTLEKVKIFYNAAITYRSKIIKRSEEIQRCLDDLLNRIPQLEITSEILWDTSKTLAEIAEELAAGR